MNKRLLMITSTGTITSQASVIAPGHLIVSAFVSSSLTNFLMAGTVFVSLLLTHNRDWRKKLLNKYTSSYIYIELWYLVNCSYNSGFIFYCCKKWKCQESSTLFCILVLGYRWNVQIKQNYVSYWSLRLCTVRAKVPTLTFVGRNTAIYYVSIRLFHLHTEKYSHACP